MAAALPAAREAGKSLSRPGKAGGGSDLHPANGVKRCWELGLFIALGRKDVPEDCGCHLCRSIPPLSHCVRRRLCGVPAGTPFGPARGVQPGCSADPPGPQVVPGTLGPAPRRAPATGSDSSCGSGQSSAPGCVVVSAPGKVSVKTLKKELVPGQTRGKNGSGGSSEKERMGHGWAGGRRPQPASLGVS